MPTMVLMRCCGLPVLAFRLCFFSARLILRTPFERS